MAGTQPAADPGGAAPPPAPVPVANGQDNTPPKFTVTDTRSAGDAIAGLLFGGDDADKTAPEPGRDQPPSRGDEPPDTGADESRPTEDEEDKGPGEQPPAAAAIEPPASWTADDKAAFQQLPPALQQAVVRRESQREAALTQRSQEAAESRRAVEAERQAAVAQRVEYLAGLQKMMVLAAPEAQALENIDWVAVQAQSPAEYTRLQAMRESMRARLGQIEQQFQAQQQQLTAYQQQQLAEHVGREMTKLNQAWPDYGDEAKGGQLRKELTSYLRDSGGYAPHELEQAYDHRAIVLATKAMLWDRQHSLSAAADAKRNNTAPQVRAPGTSQESDRGPNARMREKVNRLGRTNSVRDAGSLIAELL